MKLKVFAVTALLALFGFAAHAEKPLCEQDLKFFGSQCLKVGRACTFNSDCCSDDCTFGKCRGQNGCKASLNGACTFNSDCCEGDCNFGKCRGAGGCTKDYGESCSFSSDCCEGSCNFGTCR